MRVHAVYKTYTLTGKWKYHSEEEIIGVYLDYELALEKSKQAKEKFEEATGFKMRSRFDEDGCYIYTDDNARCVIETSTLEVE